MAERGGGLTGSRVAHACKSAQDAETGTQHVMQPPQSCPEPPLLRLPGKRMGREALSMRVVLLGGSIYGIARHLHKKGSVGQYHHTLPPVGPAMAPGAQVQGSGIKDFEAAAQLLVHAVSVSTQKMCPAG